MQSLVLSWKLNAWPDFHLSDNCKMEEQTSSSATISSNIIGVDVNALGDASNEQAPFYELTATDHINKQLLEKFKDHLEVI